MIYIYIYISATVPLARSGVFGPKAISMIHPLASATGYWLLANGHWLTIASGWLLATSCWPPIPMAGSSCYRDLHPMKPARLA